MCGRGVVCTHKVHTGGKRVVSGGVEWVLCAHTGGKRVVSGGVEWVLCAHT